jgi:hypothetical protein
MDEPTKSEETLAPKPEENSSEPTLTESPSDPTPPTLKQSTGKSYKKPLLIGVALLVLIGVGLGMWHMVKKHHDDEVARKAVAGYGSPLGQQPGDLGSVVSTDPVQRGKALSNGQCSGTGSKKLGSAPMRPSDVSIVVPYGLLAGGHVTPVDHQYYWGKVQMGEPDTYDVLAPADGHIVGIQFRDHHGQGKVKGDYRVVISYSCTFLSYFDLATSLAPSVAAQLPKGWETGNQSVHINMPVKQGQVIAKMGAQSLDYAVWDTTKTDKNLLVPDAYNVAEPWKINTVNPLNYYTEAVKQQILPLYGRTVEPRDGVIGQDIDGKLVGNWFQEGSYGYAGYPQFMGQFDYFKGHLAMVHNLYDPSAYMFSIGSYASSGDAQQFIIKNPMVAPDKADATSGIVKYDLSVLTYTDQNGASWNGQGPAKAVTAHASNTMGTALVQMQSPRKVKVEVFPGKMPEQVTGFTSAAKIYTRGEDAKNSPAIKSPGAPTSTAK